MFGRGKIYNYVHRMRHKIKYEDGGDFIIVKQRGQPDILRPKNDYALKLPTNFNFEIKPVRVAAIAHIFYVELGEKMKNLMCNIPVPFDIYISTTDENKKIALEKIFSDFKRGKVTVKVFENRGRDIAPTFVGFKDIYKNYDLCVHIHSKKSPHDSTLAGWGEYLYKSLLGSREIVSGILHIMENEKVGAVFPQYFEPLILNVNFGENYALAQEFLSRMNIKLEEKKLLEFPMGSMFWFKTSAVLPILESGLTFADFPDERGQLDGTIAHAIERIFLHVAARQGLSFVKVTADEKAIGKTSVLYPKSENEFAGDIEKILAANSAML
jgi:lipopolysaccharide biosynthesis protein